MAERASEKAEKILGQLKQTEGRQYVGQHVIARVYRALRDEQTALHCLETAHRQRSSMVAFLKTDSQLDGLRKQPRFRSIIAA